MKVLVRLIGRYKTITGKDEFEIEIRSGNTIWHVVDAFIEKYPEITKDKKFIIVSLNNILTNLDAQIKDGDAVTIAPPVVSGG